MMTILALDLGTTMGRAIRQSDGVIASGNESFKPGRYEGGGMRYLRFKRWLSEINHSSGSIDAIYFEEVRRHLGVDAAHVYGGFLGHLTAWCEHRCIPYQGTAVGTIKKFATGKGNSSKDQMIEAANKLGHYVIDDNQADAICLLHYALSLEKAA